MYLLNNEEGFSIVDEVGPFFSTTELLFAENTSEIKLGKLLRFYDVNLLSVRRLKTIITINKPVLLGTFF